jgi:hypothetical protein
MKGSTLKGFNTYVYGNDKSGYYVEVAHRFFDMYYQFKHYAIFAKKEDAEALEAKVKKVGEIATRYWFYSNKDGWSGDRYEGDPVRIGF